MSPRGISGFGLAALSCDGLARGPLTVPILEWWRTFDRIYEDLDAADQVWGSMALKRFGSLITADLES
jgi:hypothetical protein